MAEIIQLISLGYDSNVYLLKDAKFALIDTGMNHSNDLYMKLKSHVDFDDIQIIINTHAHYDHCGANPLFKNAKVLIHEADREELENGKFYGTGKMFNAGSPLKYDQTLKNGEIIDLGEINLEVLHTPGHSPGSICLFNKERKILFSGDTLFSHGSFGRVDLKGGSKTELIKSLDGLSNLDFETLYPGHEIPVETQGKQHAFMAFEIAEKYL